MSGGRPQIPKEGVAAEKPGGPQEASAPSSVFRGAQRFVLTLAQNPRS